MTTPDSATPIHGDPSQWSFNEIANGKAMPIQRPLAHDYELPTGSLQPHGIDNDSTISEMEPEVLGPPKSAADPNVRTIVAPTPIPVSSYYVPTRAEMREGNFGTAFDEYSVLLANNVLRVPLLAWSQQVLPYDDTRIEATISVVGGLDPTGTAQYVFAVSSNGSYSPGTYAILSAPGQSFRHWGKNAVFVAPVPLIATSTFPNNLRLQVVSNRTQFVNQVL